MTMFRILFGSLALSALLLTPRGASGQAREVLHDVAQAQRNLPRAALLPRTAFLEARALVAVQLSPAGDFVAYLREQKDSRGLWVLPTTGGKPRSLVGSTQADQVMWSRDGRWLFLRGPRALTIVGIDGRSGVRVPLGGIEQRRVMELDPSQPAAVLLRERVRAGKGERWRIVRMDARGRRTILREDTRWIHDVAVDGRGRIVALARFEGDHDAVYRVSAAGRLRKVLRLRPMQRVELLATMADGSLLLEGNPGDGAAGNFRRVLRLASDDSLHTIHQDPRGEADLDEVVLDPRTQSPVAASYRSTVASTHGIGDAQATVAAIVHKFPGRDIGLQVGRGPSAPWLVSERAATLRDARLHLYDPRTGSVRRILGADVGLSTTGVAGPGHAKVLGVVGHGHTTHLGERPMVRGDGGAT